MLWLLVLPPVVLAALVAVWLVTRRPPAPPEPLTSWRITLPRGADFAVPRAASFFAALAPQLGRTRLWPSFELRGEKRELALVITVPTAWEPTLRAQLAAWFPEGRLEPYPKTGERTETMLPLRLQKPEVHPIR